MECVAYMRVSTEKQAEEGNGLESQKRDIELYCRKNELIIADWYIDDGYTGANPEMTRDKLIEELGKCEYSARALIFGFRNVSDGSTRI